MAVEWRVMNKLLGIISDPGWDISGKKEDLIKFRA